jgi:hypothetical protein
MKKIILTLCFIVSIALQLEAQTDGFLNNTFEYRSVEDLATPTLPRVGQTSDQSAPIGSGLVLLTGLGLGYLTLKKKE